MDIKPDYHLPPAALASVLRELQRMYPELRGVEGPSSQAPQFSLGRLLLQSAINRGLHNGYEASVCESAALSMGRRYDPNRLDIPLAALSTRAMSTAPGAKGGYLTGTDVLDAADVLRPYSVVAEAGAVTLSGLKNDAVLPRVTTAPTGGWVGENSAAQTDETPTLGAASLTPHTAIGLIKFPMQLLRQSEVIEPLLRNVLMQAIGELLDTAALDGAGGVQPLGLLRTPGIGTQSGSSLAHAGLLSMRGAVLGAGGREDRLQWVGPPAVQTLLGAREKTTGGGRYLWDDNGILGRPAHATKHAAASTLICGDFSQAVVGIFGPGIRLEIDPSQDFNTAGLVARVLLMCDVAYPQPAAFSVASSIT